LKAKAKAKAEKDEDDDDDDDYEDAYTALVKDSYKSTRPPVGSFENCASCKQQFTVVRYLQRWPLRPHSDIVPRPNIRWLLYLPQDSCATSARNPLEPIPLRSLLSRENVKRLRINARLFTSRN